MKAILTTMGCNPQIIEVPYPAPPVIRLPVPVHYKWKMQPADPTVAPYDVREFQLANVAHAADGDGVVYYLEYA